MLKKLLTWKSKRKTLIQPKNQELAEPRKSELPMVNHMNYKVGGDCDNTIDSLEIPQFSQLNHQKQLDLLLRYVKVKSKDGVYKKESNRYIGCHPYFNCGKDLIRIRFKELVDMGFLEEIPSKDRYFKIKEEQG